MTLDTLVGPALACLGAAPAFDEPLYVGRPNTGDEERFLGRVRDIFQRRWFSNQGRYVLEFEERLKEKLGVRHCIPVCNATVALEIAARALDLSGEVIVPSFTFVATAHALRWQGITPVFADIDPATHNLDPRSVERAITARTTGIMGVHLWGRGCAVPELEEIARRHGLKLLFDAAHAFACTDGGRTIGGFGSAEVFSFHATKFINAAEGGAIATNDDELAARIRLMKNFGFAGMDRVIHLGTNGKMSELSAAMGITNLECADEYIETNRRHQRDYRAGLAGLPGISGIVYSPNERNNEQYVVIEVDPALSPLTRDELLAALHAEKILARRYFFPGCHRMEPYATERRELGESLLETERLCERVLVLPTGTAVSAHDISMVCRIIRTALSRAEEVRPALAAKGRA